MGTYTSAKYQIPAPDSADLITNGPAQFRALVDRVDALLAVVDSRYGTQKIRGGKTRVTLDAFGTATITLPAGVFTAVPAVVVSNANWTTAKPFHMEIATTSTTTFGIVVKPDATAPGIAPGNKVVDVNWVAVGP